MNPFKLDKVYKAINNHLDTVKSEWYNIMYYQHDKNGNPIITFAHWTAHGRIYIKTLKY